MDKTAQIISNGLMALGRKIDNLAMELRNRRQPDSKMNISIPENVASAIGAAMEKGLNNLKIPTPTINIPDMKAPIVNVPAPVVHVAAPIVNIPKQEAPNITVSPTAVNFPSEMSIIGMDKLLEGMNRETEEVNLLKGISNKNPIPMMVVDSKGKQINNFTSDISFPTSIELRIGSNKVSGSHPLPVALGFQIPVYDTEVIDAALAPTTTVITYKKAGVTVATKTITVSGTTTTITVV